MAATGTESKGLYRKLLAVMADVDRVQKNGRNDHFKYDYVTEADVLEPVRDAMIKHGILCMPTVAEATHEGNLSRLVVDYDFIDADTGEMITRRFVSEGQDNADKGFYKAYTGGLKYALLKTFQIPTGDDPENDSQHAPQPPRSAPRPAPAPRADASAPSQARTPAADAAYNDLEATRKRYALPDDEWDLLLSARYGINDGSEITPDVAAKIVRELAKSTPEKVRAYIASKREGEKAS